MPMTVITVKNAPSSLRGDLTKWTQEIATGVYIGNFNAKIRELLWQRVIQSVGKGEATISFAYRNELGFLFQTHNTKNTVVDFDGIPLVCSLSSISSEENIINTKGFSNASKFHQAKKYSAKKGALKENKAQFIVLDIETDGLNELENSIIEIGALKITEEISEFHTFVQHKADLPDKITELTGLKSEILNKKGKPIEVALAELKEFIGDFIIIGYGIDFDLRFLNYALKRNKMKSFSNKSVDVLKYVKKEKMFLHDYKLQTVLESYGINKMVPHRAIEDAKLTYELAVKVNKFMGLFN